MGKASQQVLASYRTLLSYAKASPSGVANELIRQRFRDSAHVKDRTERARLRSYAKDAADMVKHIAVRKELIDIYAGEKMKQDERISLSAQRVGLGLPKPEE
ncbi:unnamed protein product [Chrysoparadoxa australica]